MTRHVHADFMIQAANDTSIQWERHLKSSGDWTYTGKSGEFIFYADEEYRQRPDEPKMVDLWQWAVRLPYSKQVTTTNFYATEDEARYESVEILCRIEGSKISVEVSQ